MLINKRALQRRKTKILKLKMLFQKQKYSDLEWTRTAVSVYHRVGVQLEVDKN